VPVRGASSYIFAPAPATTSWRRSFSTSRCAASSARKSTLSRVAADFYPPRCWRPRSGARQYRLTKARRSECQPYRSSMTTIAFNVAPLQREVEDIRRLKQEALEVFNTLVMSTWADAGHHYSREMLYGYMQRVFALLDLFSSYWSANSAQTDRMSTSSSTTLGVAARR
jgi:hypothetical protein